MNALEKTLNLVNGQTALARLINNWFERNGMPGRIIKQQHVWKWLRHPSGVPTVPPEYRMAIEEITNGEVTVAELSHDIYGIDPKINSQKLRNQESESAV